MNRQIADESHVSFELSAALNYEVFAKNARWNAVS